MTTLPAMRPALLPVLLIEDEPAVMAYVRAALERSGYAVVCTESGAEGLRQLVAELALLLGQRIDRHFRIVLVFWIDRTV